MRARQNITSCHSEGNEESTVVNPKNGRYGNTFNMTKYKGFTLVELIVVITILVILGTIAFTSLSGFSGGARDSSRVSDLTNLSKALDIVYQKTGSYPTPDNAFTVTYSGGILWTQGTIGDTTLNFINAGGGIKMSKKPTDPLTTTKEYTYSKLFYGNAYQIKSDWEGESVAYEGLDNNKDSVIARNEGNEGRGNPGQPSIFSYCTGKGIKGLFDLDCFAPLAMTEHLNFMNFTDFGLYGLPQAQAATGNPTLTYIKSNYNGMVVKTESGSTKYLIAVPSLFLNTGSGTVVLPVNTQTGFYIQGQTNSGGVLFAPQLVFSSGSLPSNDTERITFASGIANAYSGTILATNPGIAPFISALTSNNTGTLASLGGGVVSGSLGGSASTPSSQTPPATPLWSVAGGGDCTAVDNSLGSDLGTSTCTDNRTYTHIGAGATHSKTYNLLKIAGKWWFNQNLAYPVAIGYQGSNTWSTTDVGYYSCPGNNSTTTADCSLVSTLGYLYQWSAAMAGGVSNNNQSSRTQGICPSGWGLPTKADFTSTADSYWPTSDNTWAGATTNWSRSYVGYRIFDATGTFNDRTANEYVWSSFEDSSTNAWFEFFHTSYPTQSYRGNTTKAYGCTVRCLKN